MYSSFIVISQVWVSSCTVRPHIVQRRCAWSATAFQSYETKIRPHNYRDWYWCRVKQYISCCFGSCRWHHDIAKNRTFFCWFCFGQCVWIVRMKTFRTNLQWPQTEFCYVNVFWLRLVTGWDRLRLMSLNKLEGICWSALLLILASMTIIRYVTQQASIIWAQ